MPENVSQIVKLKGAMPPHSRLNGVADLAPQIVADSERTLIAVVALDVDRIEDRHEHEDGEVYHVHTPVLKVTAIEIMGGTKHEEAEMMMLRARERRTGGHQPTLFTADD